MRSSPPRGTYGSSGVMRRWREDAAPRQPRIPIGLSAPRAVAIVSASRDDRVAVPVVLLRSATAPTVLDGLDLMGRNTP